MFFCFKRHKKKNETKSHLVVIEIVVRVKFNHFSKGKWIRKPLRQKYLTLL